MDVDVQQDSKDSGGSESSKNHESQHHGFEPQGDEDGSLFDTLIKVYSGRMRPP